jgi:hypothetical protein
MNGVKIRFQQYHMPVSQGADMNSINRAYRVKGEGEAPILIKGHIFKMALVEKLPLAIFLNFIGNRYKAKAGQLVIPVIRS